MLCGLRLNCKLWQGYQHKHSVGTRPLGYQRLRHHLDVLLRGQDGDGGETVGWWMLSAGQHPSQTVGRCWGSTEDVASMCGFYPEDFYCHIRGKQLQGAVADRRSRGDY
jgi:hypothetical protein